MIDLSRRVAEDAYDEKFNPGGIVDMGSAVNQLMLDDLLKWQKKHETPQDRRRCEFGALEALKPPSGTPLQQ